MQKQILRFEYTQGKSKSHFIRSPLEMRVFDSQKRKARHAKEYLSAFSVLGAPFLKAHGMCEFNRPYKAKPRGFAFSL